MRIGCVVLGHHLHARDRFPDLPDATRLFLAVGGDGGDQVADAADGAGDFAEAPVRLRDQTHACAHAGESLFHDRSRIPGGFGGALGERADLVGDYAEARARRARPRRLHGGIQGQNVGVEGDFIGAFEDSLQFLAGAGDFVHGLQQAGDHGGAVFDSLPSLDHQLVGLCRLIRVLARSDANLFERGRSLLDHRCLFLRIVSDPVARFGCVGGRVGRGLCRFAHAVDGSQDGCDHAAANRQVDD